MSFESEKEDIKRKALALDEIDRIDDILNHGGATRIIFGPSGNSMEKGNDPFYDSLFEAVGKELKLLKSVLVSEIVPPEPAKKAAPKKKPASKKKKKNGKASS